VSFLHVLASICATLICLPPCVQVGAGGAGGAGSGEAGTGGGSGRYGGGYAEVGDTAVPDTYEFKVPLGAGGDFLQVRKTKKAQKKARKKEKKILRCYCICFRNRSTYGMVY
jgi:hypothetical protein